MKNFRLQNILLISHKEKRGKNINLHPKKNLIVGRNHTGKSSIIKSIFTTLGAVPTGKLEKWDKDSVSAVSFSVDQKEYTVVYALGTRGLFIEGDRLFAVSSNHREWSDLFSKIVGFNIILADKESNAVAGDAKTFFLPFYINQDGSWLSGWDTFVGLQQFKSPVSAILDYFSGIKPPEFYALNSIKQQQQQELNDLLVEQRFLVKARDRFSKSVNLYGPKTTNQLFDIEIDLLSSELTALNKKQEHLREKYVRENEVAEAVNIQIKLAREALKSFNQDQNFLEKDADEVLICPICHAQHENQFLEILAYAEDARILTDVVIKLESDASKINDVCRSTKEELLGLEENYKRISSILEIRQGDIRFGDVIKTLGAESAFEAFAVQEKELKIEIDGFRNAIAETDAELKKLSNKKRSKDIIDEFRNAYLASLSKLNMAPIDAKKVRLTSRPSVSGSGGPRSILAYYSALWSACLGKHGSFNMPLIIDSPNQQGQDDVNLPKVMSFVANELPANAQVILCTEMDTQDTFDNRIELTEPYHVLNTGDYEKHSERLRQLVDKMFNEQRKAPEL